MQGQRRITTGNQTQLLTEIQGRSHSLVLKQRIDHHIAYKKYLLFCHPFCQHVADTFAEGNLVKQCRYEFFSRISAEG